jgi:hypothetical protein
VLIRKYEIRNTTAKQHARCWNKNGFFCWLVLNTRFQGLADQLDETSDLSGLNRVIIFDLQEIRIAWWVQISRRYCKGET